MKRNQDVSGGQTVNVVTPQQNLESKDELMMSLRSVDGEIFKTNHSKGVSSDQSLLVVTNQVQ